jgi:hypothetical protein
VDVGRVRDDVPALAVDDERVEAGRAAVGRAGDRAAALSTKVSLLSAAPTRFSKPKNAVAPIVPAPWP